MRRLHFESFAPVCPSCRVQSEEDHDLKIAWVLREDEQGIDQGALQCTNPNCLAEYPILDGIPILVPDPADYISTHLPNLSQRDDLPVELENILREGAGAGSPYDSIQSHLSSYGWEHYGEFDPEETGPLRPGSLMRVLNDGLELLPDASSAQTLLDAGCSVGRGTFLLADTFDRPTLGIDVNFAMLRSAQRILRTGTFRYNRRRSGLLYDRREFDLPFRSREQVDFWACDAQALPFRNQALGLAVAMNLLDAVSSPLDLLRSLQRILAGGGSLIVATPYDWSGSVTDPAAWMGGHSPRAFASGSSDEVLRAILTPGIHPASLQGLNIVGEIAQAPWVLRLHERSSITYQLHLVAAEAVATT